MEVVQAKFVACGHCSAKSSLVEGVFKRRYIVCFFGFVCVNACFQGFSLSLYDYFNLCAFRPHNTLLHSSRGTEHSLANSVQRSYALEWEARIDHPATIFKADSSRLTLVQTFCSSDPALHAVLQVKVYNASGNVIVYSGTSY